MPYRRGSLAQYTELQRELAERVRLAPLGKPVRTIAGVDVSSNRFSNTLYVGVIVLKFPELEVVEGATAVLEADFPYRPGFLSFRELPALMECVKKLSYQPDVFMVDGQGIAHPRRLGIASHLGVALGVPTIGVAKSVLFGRAEGGRLVHPKTCEVLGELLTTKPRANPLVVSPGHLVTLEESLALVRQCLRGYRLPEPTRLAHKLVNEFRKSH